MKKRLMTTPEDHAAYAAAFAERTPNPINAKFMATAKVYAFEDKGVLIGGYIVNTAAPYRYLQKLPEAYRETPHAQRYLGEGLPVELTCMWLDRDLAAGWKRRWIYLSAILDAMRQPGRWIVAGSVSDKVAAIHRAHFNHMIYCGPTTFPGAPYGEIYAAPRFGLLLRFPNAFLIDLMKRLGRRRKPGGDDPEKAEA